MDVAGNPLARCSKQPDSICAAPPQIAVNLPKLGFIVGDQRCDWNRPFLGIAHDLLDIALRDQEFVLAVDQYLRVGRLAVRDSVRQNEIPIARQLVADPYPSPTPRFLCELPLL